MRATRPAPSPLRTGLVLAVIYAAVAVVSYRSGTGRPLFDGFAPPTPYRWVDPPPEFRAGNQPPRSSTFEVALGPMGSPNASGSSEDGQVILSFAAGAFPPNAEDARVVVTVTPLDPATLAPPPASLGPDGNAYRVDMAYAPSGREVTELAVPGDVFVVVPEPAQALLFSSDGRTWAPLEFRPVQDLGQIGGAFTRPGHLLAVAPPVARPSDTAGTDEATRLAITAAVTAGLAVVIWAAPALWRRARPAKGGR
ncbi:MAG: hypothetical protein AB1673_14325 [Actinomycetota bacterium]